MTLTQNEINAIPAMQKGEDLSRQDLVFLDVAATKILANAKAVRKKLGINHQCAPTHKNVNLGEKLKEFLKEPKTENELSVFLKSKNKGSMQGMLSNARVRHKLCFCKVSPNHWQYLPEYDGMEGGPTSFGHFIAIQMILGGGKVKKSVLTAKYGVPASKTKSALAIARKHKARFKDFLERKNEKKEIHSNFY